MIRILKAIRSVIGIARLVMAFSIRQPAWIIQSIFIQISIAIILWIWGGSRGFEYFITGGTIMTAFGYGINIVGQVIGWHKVARILELFIVSPTSLRLYTIGIFLGGILFVIPSLLVFIGLGVVVGYTWLAIISIVTSIPVMMVSALIGVAIALSIRKPGNVSAITNPIASVLSFLPPVLYPATTLPEYLRYPSLLIPTVAGAELARSIGGLGAAADPQILVGILLIWITIILVIINRLGVKTL
ncbi:MAG: ABC transporter permease [Sulfolobales archaeon]